MARVLDLLLNRKSPGKVMFDAAITAMDRLSEKIKVQIDDREEDVSVASNVWQDIIPGDPNSPKIMGLSDNSSIIFYPKFSTPYLHSLPDKCKFATVLSGCIYDEVSKRKFSPERMNDGNPHCVKIRPTDIFKPYTKSCECYVVVHVDDCDKLLENFCP